MRTRIGVDTGGTFTDFVQFDGGDLVVRKERSTPDDPARAMLAGVAELASGRPADVVHGSTVATNAVLERRGARVALVTTAGFEDILRIGRQTRPDLYDVFVSAPRPLVDPALTFGFPERMGADGEPLEPATAEAAGTLAAQLAHAECDIIAICFLHSYANPQHERVVAARLRQAGLPVCASHEVLAEYREYERWSTTVVSAYVTPVVGRYLGRLEAALGAARLLVMQSNGGSISASVARTHAVRTILSGPAAGVIGARAVARASGFERTISFDMGGTSTDVSLIDGAIQTTTESGIGGVPVRLPMIDIHTVGAGGGSIAAVDTGGALRVGPASAGADPGPACYGTGAAFTVTDANLWLGRLDADAFLDGRMRLDAGAAEAAGLPLARALGVSMEALAEGVIRVANANMERAIRAVSLERGHDPRRFALVAFGGAGGMHACELGAALGIGTVCVPRHAGVLSALGLLAADVVRDYSVSVLEPSDAVSAVELARRLTPLGETAARDLREEGFPRGRQTIDRAIDVRYAGQSYEIAVPWSSHYVRAFHQEHARVYGYADPTRPTEVVAIRVRAAGRMPPLTLPSVRSRPHRPRPASIRRAFFAGRWRATPRYRWRELRPGAHAAGPAIVTSGEATAVVPPGYRFRVDHVGSVIISSSARGVRPRR